MGGWSQKPQERLTNTTTANIQNKNMQCECMYNTYICATRNRRDKNTNKSNDPFVIICQTKKGFLPITSLYLFWLLFRQRLCYYIIACCRYLVWLCASLLHLLSLVSIASLSSLFIYIFFFYFICSYLCGFMIVVYSIVMYPCYQ